MSPKFRYSSSKSSPFFLAFLMMFLTLGAGDRTWAQNSAWTMTQLTNGVGLSMGLPTISANGSRIVFDSGENLTGENPGLSSHIFLYNVEPAQLRQITNSNVLGNSQASINATGTRLAFYSYSGIADENPENNLEIVLYDTPTRRFTQITHSVSGANVQPCLNGDGTIVAFISTANLTHRNRDGNFEVFVYNVVTKDLIQVTNSRTGSNEDPKIDAAGTRIVFHSTADLTGENPDGNSEIFLCDLRTRKITQITKTIGVYNNRPKISALGNRVVFSSPADLTGQNPDGNYEIFLYSVNTGRLRQITNTVGGVNFDCSLNADGSLIAFDSTNDFTGQNTDYNSEIFIYNIGTNNFSQITDNFTGGASNFPSISAFGNRIAFYSNGNLTGQNPLNSPQIYLAERK